MFGRSVTAAAQITNVQKRMIARIPSIKFTHGDQTAIQADMAARGAPTWFVKHTTAASASQAHTPLPEPKIVVVAGSRTLVTHMEGDFYGNPFKNASRGIEYDDLTIQLIELGGAKPDIPKPVKDDKKKK